MDKKLNNNNKINKKQNKNSSKNTSGFEPDNFDWKKASKTSFIWMAIILGAVYVSGLLTNGGKKEIEIEYTEYKEYLDNGEIAKGVIMGDVFHGEFKESKILESPYGNQIDGVLHFKLTLPFIDRDIIEEWDNAGIQYTFKEKQSIGQAIFLICYLGYYL